MDAKMLESLGLTSGESRAYLSLLRIGSGTAGTIAQDSGISPSKIYDVLKRLSEKGLCGNVLKGKVKLYRPQEPAKLHDLVSEEKERLKIKEEAVSGLIPALEKIYQASRQENRTEILEGMRGVRHFFDMSLESTKKGDEILVIGYPKEASELFNAYFKQFHKIRAAKGVRARVVYDYDTWFLKAREQRRLMEQRYLPQGIVTPTFIYLFNNTVGIITISSGQKLCFLMENPAVALSYKEYFELMWKRAVKPKRN